MSNVLARFRGEGESEILKDTRIARGHIMTWLHNEKNLPSKYRMAMIPPISTDFRELVMAIRAAERDYPRTQELLEARRADIRCALAAERALWDDLQAVYDMRRNNGGCNLDAIQDDLTALVKVYRSLQKWAKNGKIQKENGKHG